jgi:hypothetical protein
LPHVSRIGYCVVHRPLGSSTRSIQNPVDYVRYQRKKSKTAHNSCASRGLDITVTPYEQM